MSCNKLPLITGGFLNLTQKCNLKCKYCFVHQQPKEMTLETAIDAVNFYAKNAVLEGRTPSVTFFGGEPMLKYDEIIVPVVKYIRENYGDYELTVTTNGTLMTEDRYKFLRDNDVFMLLSLDGMEEIQNNNRPYHNDKGSFNDIDVKLHLKYFPLGTFRATIFHETVDKLYENYLWGEAQGFDNCSFILDVFSDWSDEKLEILKSELNKIAEHIKLKIKNNEPYMLYNEFNAKKEQFLQLKEVDNEYFRESGQECLACGTCGLGASFYASVGSNGDLYSCQEMTENPEYDNFKVGNIYTGVDDIKRLELSNSFNKKNVESEESNRCQKCKLNKVCNGGCTINNFFRNGSLEVMPKSLCVYYEHCLDKYEEIYGGEK